MISPTRPLTVMSLPETAQMHLETSKLTSSWVDRWVLFAFYPLLFACWLFRLLPKLADSFPEWDKKGWLELGKAVASRLLA